MKNDLELIHLRTQEIIGALMGGIPLSLYDAEMEVLDKITEELLDELGYGHDGYRYDVQLKIALMNMYLLGKTYGKNEK